MTHQVDIESLSRRSIKPETFPTSEIEARFGGLSDLVRVAHGRLVENPTELTAKIKRLPDQSRIFDAYFSLPYFCVIKIGCVGLPETPNADGLFISLHYKADTGEIISLVDFLDLPKSPQVISLQDVLDNWEFEPEQLQQIGELIRIANPISRRRYNSFFKKSKIRSG